MNNLPVLLDLLSKALALSLCLFLVGLIVWAVARHFVWRFRRGKARRDAQRRRIRPDGQPYPPTGMGICCECERADLAVYHLPSGRRLCKDCYARLEVHSTDDAPGSRT